LEKKQMNLEHPTLNVEPCNLCNVFLIGYRCSGKSSVGKSLAARLGWPFVDTDLLLVADRQTSIKEIVESCGWETFRELEHEIVKRVCSRNRQVVATGGGVVLADANVGRMQANGKIVWLRAAPETIRRRMMQDSDTEAFRPALTSKNSVIEIEETLVERDPFYRHAMDFLVDTDDRRIDEICDAIIAQLIKLETKLNEAHRS
jgi:shikimate kinase